MSKAAYTKQLVSATIFLVETIGRRAATNFLMAKREKKWPIGARLKEAREALQPPMSQPQLASKVNMTQQGIGEIEAGQVERPKKLREIARVVRRSEEWLLGESDDASSPELTYEPLDGENERGVQSGIRYASTLPGASPEVDSRSGAGRGQTSGRMTKVGYWAGERVIDEWVFPASFHREMRTQAGLVWIMPVVGNSMEPELFDGDRVLVDTTHIQPSPDAIYCIDEGAGPEVKQIQRIRGSDPPLVSIISINPSYPPADRPLADVRIVGRVCGRVSRM